MAKAPEAKGAMDSKAGHISVNRAPGKEIAAAEDSRDATRYHHGDLWRMLIVAGREMVALSGPDALSLRAVARRAKVSHNAPYRHFASREALLAAIAAAGFDDLRHALLSAAEHTPEGRLTAMGKAYIRFALDHRPEFQLMFGGSLDKSPYPELRQAAAAAFEALRTTAASGQGTGGDPVRAWALAHGLAHLVADRQLSLEDAFAALDR
ncbi:TetR/AcrR family transcriptional regulator [Microvirga puerhi]|uniref:TetR/AcrR family transcriptional regulator n=1 Tax=Microvirga puerhi TaxID=2876078 RepID=A0ABS7VRA9_9HYPH|nr:TetR/AcrR family transcriptional regulator [Microvirga puerhi]MBZ6077650.1 TetR/AcrR family transcriptional regulator [Microvirga puerhi]